MSVPAIALLVATSAYTGFQATVRLLVYPQFAAVGPAEFPAYEARHQRLITRVVGPLFLALVITSVAVVVDPPPHRPFVVVLAVPVLVAALLAITGGLAVPLHRRLTDGYDPTVAARLLRLDSLRVTIAVVSTALAVYLTTGS